MIIMHAMKKISAMLLFFLLVSIFPPLSVAVSPYGDETRILTLDVCSTSNSALSVSADIPAVQEYAGKLPLIQSEGKASFFSCRFKPSVFTFKKDRPPEV
jgi:hypothetical protein